jgi:hypothetical protein
MDSKSLFSLTKTKMAVINFFYMQPDLNKKEKDLGEPSISFKKGATKPSRKAQKYGPEVKGQERR